MPFDARRTKFHKCQKCSFPAFLLLPSSFCVLNFKIIRLPLLCIFVYLFSRMDYKLNKELKNNWWTVPDLTLKHKNTINLFYDSPLHKCSVYRVLAEYPGTNFSSYKMQQKDPLFRLYGRKSHTLNLINSM